MLPTKALQMMRLCICSQIIAIAILGDTPSKSQEAKIYRKLSELFHLSENKNIWNLKLKKFSVRHYFPKDLEIEPLQAPPAIACCS